MGQGSVQQLAVLAADSVRKAQILTVASGKGGVGKTNIAANLAICLAASGKRVAILDADFGLANLDIVLGISSKYNLSHFIKGVKRLDEISQPVCEGVDIYCGLSGVEHLTQMTDFTRERIVTALDSLADNYDIVVVDTAAGIGKTVMAFCMASDHTVLVGTPDPAAITDVYTLLKAMIINKYDGRTSLLVNMAHDVNQGKNIYRQIASAAAQFLNVKLNMAGVMLKDEHVVSAVRKREPVVLAYPKSAATKSLMAVAARLSRVPLSCSTEEGFFRKVVNWFF
ncbi:MAG: MinD/ParA family protein [Phycisphaerae bacterium]